VSNYNKIKNILESTTIKITEDQVLNFLKNKKRWPIRYPWNQNTVEIINNTAGNSNNFFETYYNGAASYLDYEKWHRYYALGYTTIISHVLDLTEDLRNLEKKLGEVTGMRINANFYFSKPGQQPSFMEHHHPYDVFVKQIYGSSPWLVNNKKILLKAQNTLVVPKYAPHHVYAKECKKLSLTFNLE